MFSRKRWRRGGGEQTPARSTQACRFFRVGNCTFGSRCRFSHDKTGSSTASSGRGQERRPREPDDDRVLSFKRLITGRTLGSGSFEQNLFSLGVEVLTNVQGADAQQQIVTLLASEDGLSCIRQVVESRIPRAMVVGTTFAKKRLWETDMRPLFRLITFESVILSNILEDKIATIYNFIAGVGGTRLPVWLDLAKSLAEASDLSPAIQSIEIIELCLAVLSKMMGCNSSHVSNPLFREYAASFIGLAGAFDDVSSENKMSKIQATEYANFITRRLDAEVSGGGIGHLNEAFNSISPNFRQDLPGSLSGEGPRHDNDHDDITKISILPTRDEIASDRKEYLPTVDPTLWHRQGIIGRLDREFRLLREDTIGQLRNVVRAELDQLQLRSNQRGHDSSKDSRAHPSSKSSKDMIQYCTYHDTSITTADFDRRTGPEFVFRFRQPARKFESGNSQRGDYKPGQKEQEARSLAQRRDWWAVRAKKRLQSGGLVCVVDSRGYTHFMVVADSTQRFAGDAQQRQNARGPFGKTTDERNEQDSFTLADDPNWSFVKLRMPPGGSKHQLEDILKQLFFRTKMRAHARPGTWRREYEPACMLVEFPGILLDSFIHTLQALQTATTTLNIPFADLLQTSKNGLMDTTEDGEAGISPPKYAQNPGFNFDLSCLSTKGSANGSLLSHGTDAPISAEEVEGQTHLDRTQSEALVCALSRSVALVQGPPGTGKTFVGVEILKALLHNRKKADLGPILIVCYTNHALDQLLEHVLDATTGTTAIRMGSRSKSVRLQELNLYSSSRDELRTRSEKSALYEDGTQLDRLTIDFRSLSTRLGRSMSFNSIAIFLQQHHRSYFIQLFPQCRTDGDDLSSDGFTTVQQSKDKIFLKWMRGDVSTRDDSTPLPTQESHETAGEMHKRLKCLDDATDLDLLGLSVDERNTMFQIWQEESFCLAASEICREYESFVSAKESYDQVRRETDLRCLQRADIVGVTTTGLARNLHILKNLRSKVLLCEEAGEVLEAHMLSSLIPSLEHLILIGDHQQLRPQVQNYDLRSDSMKGAQYSFDMSLFERLVSPPTDDGIRLPFSQLFTQRRMSPSISDLIRAPLYPNLQDGPNVFEYPGVPGIQRRLFWLQHDHLEQGASSGERQADPTSTSRTNLFEVEMAAALVSHLYKQGTYGPGDIAVLTPYLGQMMMLQRRMSSMFEVTFNERDEADMELSAAVDAVVADNTSTSSKAPGTTRMNLSNSVRIATVDNFQGEEAKVVVVSMVRSNEQQRCGFLSTSNRINVLLSRAKHGMYIIGNSDTCSRVPMWKQVIANLEEGGNIGPTLPLRCSRHPGSNFEASMPEHFSQFAPDGGCLEKCLKPLPCHHICTKPCHADAIHAAVECSVPCTRPQLGCDHACPLRCSDPCPPRCSAAMPGVQLSLKCGHPLDNPVCWQAQSPDSVRCLAKVSRTVPGCSHTVTIKCGLTDVKHVKFKCTAPCGSTLECGHACSRPCFECRQRKDGVIASENHGSCQSLCGQKHDKCGHACLTMCHAATGDDQSGCPPCSEPCNARCSHSQCTLQCGKPCIPCKEKDCASHCPHSTCTLPCAVPCDWVPCSQRCDKYLACGHRCPSLCGEQCPGEAFCQTCAASLVLNQQVCPQGETYGKVNLDDDPCIFLDCGHVLSTHFMDVVMDMKSHYVMEAGRPQRLAPAKTTLVPLDTTTTKAACTQCQVPVSGVTRYSRLFKQKRRNEMLQRTVVLHNEFILKSVDALEAIMENLQARREPRRPTWRGDSAVVSLPHRVDEKALCTALFEDCLSESNSPRGLPWRREGAMARWTLQSDEKATCTALFEDLLSDTNDTRFESFLVTRRHIWSSVSKMDQHEKDCQRTFPPYTTPEVNGTDIEIPAMEMSGQLQLKLLLLWYDIFVLDSLCSAIDREALVREGLSTGGNASTVARLRKLYSMFKNDKSALLLKRCDQAAQDALHTQNVRLQVEAKLATCTLHLVLVRVCSLILERPWCSYSEDDRALVRKEKKLALHGAVRAALTNHKEKHRSENAARAQMVAAHPEIFAFELEKTSEDIPGMPGLVPYHVLDVSACSAMWPTGIKRAYNTIYGESRKTPGRWYLCANRHPFKANGDEMSADEDIKTVRCPECMAPVG